MAKRRRPQRSARLAPSKTPSPSAPYNVDFAETAFEVYRSLHRKMQDAEARGDESSSHHTVFRMVEEVIKVTIPRDPLNRKYGLSGPLSQFFRIKKGRFRICWAASSRTRRVCILFISETLRKEGDASDPYNIFTKLVMSGKYDKILSDLALGSS